LLCSLVFNVAGFCNTEPVSYHIPFVKSQGLMLIEATLNDEQGWFVFDTGADAILINEQESRACSTSFQTLSGSIYSSKKKIKEITIGNVVMNDVEAYSVDLSSIEHFTNRKLLGVLGTRFLKGDVLFIDNINNVIQILDKHLVKNLSGKNYIASKISMDNGIPIVPIKIGQFEYRFGLDTGASASVISESLIKEQPDLFKDNFQSAVQIHTVDNKNIIYNSIVTTNAIQLAKVNIQDFQLGVTSFQEINEVLSIKIDGILSLNQISFKEVYIDFDRTQIILLP